MNPYKTYNIADNDEAVINVIDMVTANSSILNRQILIEYGIKSFNLKAFFY